MYDNVERVFGGTQPMLELIEQIYAAAHDEALWHPVLKRTAGLIGGESIALFARDSGRNPVDLLCVVDMPADVWDKYATYYAERNLIMQRAERQLSPHQTWFSHAVCSDQDLDRSEFGADFFGPSKMHYSAGLRFEFDGGVGANLSCQRERHTGAFDDVADVVYQTLRPHFARALSMRRKLSELTARSLAFETALEVYDHAVIGLDGQGYIVVCSGSAEAILAKGSGLRQRGRRLASIQFLQDAALQRIIADALHPGLQRSKQTTNSILLACGDGESELRVTVLPHRRASAGQVDVAALVYLSDSAQVPASRGAVLRALYRLTPTEGRVADMLASGMDVKEVAEKLRITHETARYYVKSVLKKTGARRQAELLRLLLSLPGK